MAISYSAGTATVTGGSKASPNLMSALLDAVLASDATKASRSNKQGTLTDVTVSMQGWLKIDDDLDVALKGSSQLVPVGSSSGGVIHGKRSKVRIETGTARTDAACNIESGFTFIAERDFTNGINPAIYYTPTARHDYPTILQTPSTDVPTEIDIGGLDLVYNSTTDSFFKLYFGLATTVTKVNNVRFIKLASSGSSTQYYGTTYSGLVVQSLDIPSETTANTVTMNDPVFELSANAAFTNAIRGATFVINNPTFPGAGTWNGSVSGLIQKQANSAIKMQFTNALTVKSGTAALSGVAAQWTREDVAAPSYTETNTTINATTNGSGQASQLLLDAYFIGTGTAVDRYRWNLKARKYDYKTPSDFFYEDRVYFSTGKVTEEIQMLSILSTLNSISQATAAAYTGITISGGSKSLTLSSAHTVPECWAYYRNFIVQTANFSVVDEVVFDGAILNLGTWTLVPEGNLTYGAHRISGGTVQFDTPGTHSPAVAATTLKFTAAGTYALGGASITGTVTLVNTSGGSVTVEIPAGVTYVNSGPNITVNAPTQTRGLQFTGLVAGSTVRVFDTGTTTEAFATTSSGTSETWSENAAGSRTVDYTILKDGYLPIRVVGVTVTGAEAGGVLATPIQQSQDRAYVASTGLTFGTNAYANTGTKKFGLTTPSTLQNFYARMIESWRTEAALRNKAFPIVANGPNSFTFTDGWEFDLTTYPNSITNLSRDGLRYLNASNVQTAVWAAILTAGVSSGMRVRYQQTDGGTTQLAAVTSGNMDQLVQVYGDASHGGFDYRAYLVLKAQEMGYNQGEADAIATYGALEDQLYVIGLVPTPNGIATGDPGISGVTITDHGASPVSWNGGNVSITITDSAANSGTNILRWLRYNFETGGTFQGKDAFNWHDLIQPNGSKFKTVRGAIYGDTGATLKGVRVLRGTDPHPDFDLYTFDDGTTYAPPVLASVSVTGLPNAGAVPTRLQLANVTAKSAAAWQATTAYTAGAMRRRTTGLGTENTAGLYFRCTTAGTSGGTEPAWNTTVGGTTTDGSVVWTTYAVLFYDADPAATSYSTTYTDGRQFAAGETVEMRFAEMNGGTSFKRAHATTLVSTAGFAFAPDIDVDDVFSTNGLDGAAYDATFSPNFAADYIVMDTNTDFSGKAAYAYFCYTLTTSQGMYEFWDGVTALDASNYRIETDVLNLYFDETAGFVKQTDNVRIFRKDGARPALDPTTGGNGIEMNWRVPVSTITVSGSNVITGDISTVLAAIPSASQNADAVWVSGTRTLTSGGGITAGDVWSHGTAQQLVTQAGEIHDAMALDPAVPVEHRESGITAGSIQINHTTAPDGTVTAQRA